MEGDRAVYPARPVVGAVGGRCPGGRSSAAVRFGPVWRSCCGLQAAALYSLGTVVGIGSSWSVAAMASSRTGGERRPSRVGVRHRGLGPLPVGELYGIRHWPRRFVPWECRRSGSWPCCPVPRCHGATVLRVLGRPGRALQERAQGVDHRMVVPGRAAETVSVRADFAVDVLDGFEVRCAAVRLAAELGPGCGRVSRRRARSPWRCAWLNGRPCRRLVRWSLLRRTRTIFTTLCTTSWTAAACNAPGYGASPWPRRRDEETSSPSSQSCLAGLRSASVQGGAANVQRVAAGRSGVRRSGGEGDVKQVQDLGVDGPPVGCCLGGQPGVQVFGNAQREANHDAVLAS